MSQEYWLGIFGLWFIFCNIVQCIIFGEIWNQLPMAIPSNGGQHREMAMSV